MTRIDKFTSFFISDIHDTLVSDGDPMSIFIDLFGINLLGKLTKMNDKRAKKVVRFFDPDKNIIEVGESIEYIAYRLKNEGLTVEQISNATNMPIDFVQESIEKYNK